MDKDAGTPEAIVREMFDLAHSLGHSKFSSKHALTFLRERIAALQIRASVWQAAAEGKAPLVLDKCEFCLGRKGNTPGNENVIGGVVVCDDCHVLLMRITDAT